MHTDIDLILLDMVMPEMNGFDVLTAMNNNRQIEDIPVVMISAENGIEHIERAYDLGVTDHISRPFDCMVVRRRVVNALILAAKQKRLMRLAAEQIYEKEKISDLMINIFSHIVEFRNGESGPHVLHIRTITEVLLNRLVQKTDRYSLTQEDIQLISSASALHDIGKVSIPDEIINKPGKLTKEEFEIMKSHTTVGADILHDLPFSNEEPLLKTAYEIARWHHERYDGRGYPDGLTGEEIPIAAQVVSVADVYDALTSVRCYKSAYDHETALRMIVNGRVRHVQSAAARVPARCVAADQGASARGERGIYAQHGAHAAAFDRNAAQAGDAAGRAFDSGARDRAHQDRVLCQAVLRHSVRL